jgi:ABC-type branched-subunit amino acid transport system substrate-binding protein
MRSIALLAAFNLLLAACSFPGSVTPTVKIGLSAPFEGLYRDLGYEVLYAVRLAVSERNQAGGIDGGYMVELVALNDFDEPEQALIQAHKMDVDPDVLGVVGGWSAATARAVVPEYERLGLAFLSPPVDYTQPQPSEPVSAELEAAYKELSGGVAPGSAASWSYEAALRLLDALDLAARTDGQPTRQGVQDALAADQ